jgi:hypothetical protein
MSYDLYFYKHREAQVSESDISAYLTNNLCTPNESGNQWFFENEDTGVYFSFDLNEPDTDPDLDEPEEVFEYLYTFFSFNLNFLRPDFFGREAFLFVDKLVNDLGLYVVNPQANAEEDYPVQPEADELYMNWSELNANHSAHLYNELELQYYPQPASDAVWEYNFNRAALQAELGNEYFVPKIFVLQTVAEKRIITFCVWPDSLPIIVPKVDYFFIGRERTENAETIEESGLISLQTFRKNFASYVSDFGANRIIYPTDAERLAGVFNKVEFEHQFDGFAEKLPFEKIVNVIPKTDEEGFTKKITTVLD